jgi:threonine dehydratase
MSSDYRENSSEPRANAKGKPTLSSGRPVGDHCSVESILEAIGDTPLVRLQRCGPANGAELWLKLEYRNPSGSMKDRMALAMIEGAESDGLVSPGETIVEYTGGSTGPALALVCKAKGYRALIVMADCFSEERFQLMRALGAEIDVVPSIEGRPKVTAQDIENMVARAAELAARPDHYATDQFNNPYIIPDHRDHLGREIWEQTAGRVTAFCQGMGTASSVMVSRTPSSRTVSLFRRMSRRARRQSVAASEARFSSRGGAGSSCPSGMRTGLTTSSRSATTKQSR